MTRRFPSVGTILAIHEILIEETGGAPGLRDVGALESAVMRPQIGYYDGIVEEAAALMESLAINHPFVDGNKRIAFAAADTFLLMNGHYIDCDGEEAHAHFMYLFDTNSFRFAELVAWLSRNVRPLP
jgi:death-on-curing protein